MIPTLSKGGFLGSVLVDYRGRVHDKPRILAKYKFVDSFGALARLHMHTGLQRADPPMDRTPPSTNECRKPTAKP